MDIHITQETCCKKDCNILFWITTEHYNSLVKCKNTFYCPNGHPQNYLGEGETDDHKIARIKQELRDEKQCSERLVRSNSALRGVITKNKLSSVLRKSKDVGKQNNLQGIKQSPK